MRAALADQDIAAIRSRDLARDIGRIRTLTQQRGPIIVRVGAKPDVVEVTRRLLQGRPGKTVLWVGNTTNLDRIYPDLGGAGGAAGRVRRPVHPAGTRSR